MKKYILIILCCLTSFPLWSYNVNMIVEHYSVDQGLPNNTVNCTLKDRDGFIYKPQNKMFRFYKTFCSRITLINTNQNVILNPI